MSKPQICSTKTIRQEKEINIHIGKRHKLHPFADHMIAYLRKKSREIQELKPIVDVKIPILDCMTGILFSLSPILFSSETLQ